MKYFLIDAKNRITNTPHSSSMFKQEMYHGSRVFEKKIGYYHKNIFKSGLIFKPDYSLVIDKSVLHIFEKEKLNEIKKIEHLKFFNFNYFDVTNEEIRYLDEYEKNFSSDGYYESGLIFVDSSKYELYMVRFLNFGETSHRTLVEFKGIDGGFRIDNCRIKNLQSYRSFEYMGNIFLCEELFFKINPYLDMDFFEVVQVNIPEDIIFIKEER